MAEWLAETYQVLNCEAGKAIPDFDLCIVDVSTLESMAAEIIAYKKSQYPKFAPVILLTQRQGVGKALQQLGKSIDDWLTTPLNKDVLRARMLALLQTRSTTVNMFKLQDGAKNLLKSLQCRQFAVDQHAIVAIADLQGRITYVNDKFCDISGYCRQELLGRDHFRVNSDQHPKGFWKEMYQTLATGQPWRAEVCNRAKDGRLYWVDTTIAPLLDRDDQVQEYFAISTDMTERKRIEMEAKHASYTKSEFLANMSHEIRTPMNGVIGMLDVMQNTNLNHEQSRMLSTVRESALAMLRILNDILDFSKIEAGKMLMETIPTTVRNLVEDVAQLLISPAAAKQISLQVFVAPELPVRILVDPLRLRQILLNLLGNALKFTVSDPSRPSQVMLKVESATLGDGRPGIRFRVRDNGIGMSAQTVRGLFRPFSQADETTTRRFGGTGLGLSITLRLVELLEGKIFVRSKLGEGSEFWFELPLEAATSDQQDLQAPNLSGVAVIIVTSQPLYEEILTAYLRTAGAELKLVANLADLAAAWQSFPSASVVLLDPSFAKQAMPIAVSDAAKPMRIVQLTTRGHGGSRLGNSIMTPAEPLLYLDLLQSVAVAAGRLTEVNQPVICSGLSGMPAPTVEEARRAGRLILLAEDNEINREVIQAQVRILGYASETAEDGLQALAAWRSGRYALLLTDFHMPNMDGYQLTAAIRAEENQERRLPIIAISADALQGEAERCVEKGMSDYLSKPLRLVELAAVLTKWLPRTEPRTEAPATAVTPATPPRSLVWDPEALPATMGGDTAYQRKVLDKFMLRAEAYVNELAEAIRATDPARVADAAHKLKSPALTVGAMQLGDLCRQLEAAGRQTDLQTIAALAEHLDAYYIAAAEAIRAT